METRSSLRAVLPSLALAAFGLILAAGSVLILFLVGTRVAYSGKALPGVTAAGLSLSGLTEPEIELALGESLT